MLWQLYNFFLKFHLALNVEGKKKRKGLIIIKMSLKAAALLHMKITWNYLNWQITEL